MNHSDALNQCRWVLPKCCLEFRFCSWLGTLEGPTTCFDFFSFCFTWWWRQTNHFSFLF